MALKPAGKAILITVAAVVIGVGGVYSGILDKFTKKKPDEVVSAPMPQSAETTQAPAPAPDPVPVVHAPPEPTPQAAPSKGDAFDQLIRQSGAK
jgi:hypothetical protein